MSPAVRPGVVAPGIVAPVYRRAAAATSLPGRTRHALWHTAPSFRESELSWLKNVPYEWAVGLRYTRAGRRSGRDSFISFIALTSMLGIALGVAALITVLSVMNGFQTVVRDRMLAVVAHIEIVDRAGVSPNWQELARFAERNPEVRGAAPFLDGQVLLTRGTTLRGVVMRGILPSEEPKVTDIVDTLKEGTLDVLKPGEFNVILGAELASALSVKVGDPVTMMATDGQALQSRALPQLTQLKVAGIFSAGHFEFDSSLAYIHIQDAQTLFHQPAPSGVRLRIRDVLQAPEVARQLAADLPPSIYLRNWTQQNATWFAAVKTQKRMMFLILALIIAVAAFNLVSTLVMTVKDKQADIAILRTLGATPGSIMKIFVIQGAVVGLVGTASGVLLGTLLALNIHTVIPFIERLLNVQFLNQSIYLITELPSELRWHDVGLIGGFAVLLAFVATLYPSWSAARVRPAQALRES